MGQVGDRVAHRCAGRGRPGSRRQHQHPRSSLVSIASTLERARNEHATSTVLPDRARCVLGVPSPAARAPALLASARLAVSRGIHGASARHHRSLRVAVRQPEAARCAVEESPSRRNDARLRPAIRSWLCRAGYLSKPPRARPVWVMSFSIRFLRMEDPVRVMSGYEDRDGQSQVGHAALILRSWLLACVLRVRIRRGANDRPGHHCIVADRRTSNRNRAC